MFKKLKFFKKFTKLNKDFGELDNKLIIQHYNHIYIRTFTGLRVSSMGQAPKPQALSHKL